VPSGGATRALLSVDDGGEWLVVVGRRCVLGHTRGGRADIGLFADVEAEHLTLELVESFHGGAAWQLLVTGGREVRSTAPRAETFAPGARVPLVDGTRVVLAPKLAFVFQRPDPASASARLLLEHGHEAAGASRVLLLVPGVAGRALVSASRTAHVQVAGLTAEVELAATERADGLDVRCVGGVRVAGTGALSQPQQSLTLALPPAARVDLAVGARSAPPFQVALAPLGA
jgi:hypothetical protein